MSAARARAEAASAGSSASMASAASDPARCEPNDVEDVPPVHRAVAFVWGRPGDGPGAEKRAREALAKAFGE